LHYGFVATPAGRLRDRAAKGGGPDRLREAAVGEVIRVHDAVPGLGPVLADQVVRHVAVVADGHRVVASLQPAVVLLVHDMAVRAGPGVVGEVRPAFRVPERVGPESQYQPDEACGDEEDGVST